MGTLPREFSVTYNSVEYPCIFITDVKTAHQALDKLIRGVGIIGADTETGALPKYKGNDKAALDPYRSRIRLLQIFSGKSVAIFDMFEIEQTEDLKAKIRTLFETRPSVFHNLQFDLKFLRKWYGVDYGPMECTCIMSRIVLHHLYFEQKSASLEAMAEALFKEDLNKRAGASDWSVMQLSFEQVRYSATDAIVVKRIYDTLAPKMQKLGLWNVYKLYVEAQHGLVDMELNGIAFDKKHHMQNVVKWREELVEATEDLKQQTGLDDITDTKVAEYLERTLPPASRAIWPVTETGKLMTDAHTLVDFSYLDICKPFARYQKLKKLCTSFGRNIVEMINPETGRLHPSYRVAGARTGRLSCSDPNLQNQPRDTSIRKAYVAPEGYVFVGADFSQIEVRIIAELSQDENMIKAYEEGLDMYSYTASLLNDIPIEQVTKEQRQASKACFSGDTEVLTPDGWVALRDWHGQDVMQYSLPAGVKYNYDTESRTCRFSYGANHVKFDGMGGRLEFVRPLGFIKKSGVVHRYYDRRNSLALTDDHQVIYVNMYGSVIKKEWKDVGYIRSFINAGWYEKEIKVPNNIVRFIAALIADGSFANEATYRFGFSKRRKHRRLLEYILPELGDLVTYSSHKSGNVYTTRVKASPELVAYVERYITHDKILSWKALHDFNSDVFLEEAQFWDGHVCKRNKAIVFSTTVKQTIEVMQAMAHTSGRLFNFRRSVRKNKDVYSATYSIHFHQPLSRPHMKKGETSEETVYCLEVPSGALMIRHNGKISVQGNCVLGLNYGLGAKKFSHYAKKNYGVDITHEEAKKTVEAYRELYSGLRDWQLKQVEKCQANRYMCVTKMGKTRKLTQDTFFGACMNHSVQGTGAEIMLQAIVNARKNLKGLARLIATIHDELIVECREEKAETVKKILEKSMFDAYQTIMGENRTSRGLVKAIHGKNWAEIKD